MRVLLVTPYDLDTNPYIRLLSGALEAEGVDIRVARGRNPLLLWRAVWRDGVPDVVHVQWHHRYFTDPGGLVLAVLRTGLFFLQWAGLRLAGARFVWTVHNLLDHDRRQARWELFACRRWARRVNALIAHCPEAAVMAAEAYGIPANRVRVVPHGRFPEGPTPGLSREAARRIVGLEAESRVFLYFGRVRPYKGLEALLTEFADLEAPDIRLILLGYPDSEELGARIASQAARDARVVTRLEFVGDEVLEQYLAAADVVVLPYRDLLTSGAAILAASRGRPVVAPAIGCLRSLPGETAILYDPDDPEGLGAGLRAALDAPLDEMGAAARQNIDRVTWVEVAAETVAVYREVRDRSGAASPAERV